MMSTRLAKQVGKALKARHDAGNSRVLHWRRHRTCTITKVAGSSDWFDRGFVTYSNMSKEEMLGVSPDTMKMHGAVSEVTAREMAEGALQYSRSQVTLAVTGIAGPAGGTPEKPVGTVWFAWVSKGKTKQSAIILAVTGCHSCESDTHRIAGVLDLLNSQAKKALK
jgi:nicotinamide-nucleotide amidase